MAYTHIGPSPKEQRMFIFGIVFGAVLSILGNILVTVLFRTIDRGISIENGFYLVISFILFIGFLYLVLKVFKFR